MSFSIIYIFFAIQKFGYCYIPIQHKCKIQENLRLHYCENCHFI